MSAIYFSEYINKRNGGVLLTPWNVGEIPEEYRDAYHALQKSDAVMKKKNALEGRYREFRARHPTYRKYGRR